MYRSSMRNGFKEKGTMPKRIVFQDVKKAELEEFDLPGPKEGDVSVKTLFSMMSIGTENIIYNKIYEPGSHWDLWVGQYPFYPGYCCVGEVQETKGCKFGLKAGDRVVLRGGHASGHVIEEDKCFLVPDGVKSQDALWFAFAKIAFMGIKAANIELGDSAMVIGAGPIGQMALRWLFALGTEKITVVDVFQKRLELAKLGGADMTIDKSTESSKKDADQTGQVFKKAFGGNNDDSPQLVMDCTGNDEVFQEALQTVANQGRVVLLGDTGYPSNQRLTSDVMIRGIKLTGAHDLHETARWNAEHIYRYFFHLVRTNRFNLDQLITHRFKPENCQEAYQTANTSRQDTMGIVFEWN